MVKEHKPGLVTRQLVGAVAAPVQGLSDIGKSLLLGPKIRSGPQKGKRLQVIGVSTIDRKEYLKNRLRKATKTDVGFTKIRGHTVYYKTKYGPGGAIGFTKKNPLTAGVLGAGTSYALYKAIAAKNKSTQQGQQAVQNNPAAASTAWG